MLSQGLVREVNSALISRAPGCITAASETTHICLRARYPPSLYLAAAKAKRAKAGRDFEPVLLMMVAR